MLNFSNNFKRSCKPKAHIERMKEIKQDAAVPGRSRHADRRLSFDRHLLRNQVSPCRLAICWGLAAVRYWHGQWAVLLIECMPPSDCYISAHWHYRFSSVHFSSDVADIRRPMCTAYRPISNRNTMSRDSLSLWPIVPTGINGLSALSMPIGTCKLRLYCKCIQIPLSSWLHCQLR